MGKKVKEVEIEMGPSAEDNFAMMFTSLNLILLSFFILLNSISIKDTARQRRALGSLRGTFGILPGGLNPSREGNKMQKGDIIGGPSSARRALLSETKDILNRAGLLADGRDVAVVQTADGLVVHFAKRVLFKPDRTELNPRIFPVLDKLAIVFTRLKRRVIIRGFATPGKPRRFPSNLELSVSRASRVARYFVEACGVSAALIVAQGMGQGSVRTHRRVVEMMIPSDSLKGAMNRDDQDG